MNGKRKVPEWVTYQTLNNVIYWMGHNKFNFSDIGEVLENIRTIDNTGDNYTDNRKLRNVTEHVINEIVPRIMRILKGNVLIIKMEA